MNFEQYKKESERTNKDRGFNFNVIHAALGIHTEGAELADVIKKYIFYGKKIDVVNIKEEIGDILWYIAILCREFNFNLDDILQINIDKLKIRFPEKFTSENALNRNLEKEREVLENGN